MKRFGLLVAVLGLPPLALQLLAPVPRLDADAVEYFSHVRSLYFDQDLDFANEFAHFGILSRGDKRQPTVTGHRRTIFSVGPALLWMPFYAASDLVARAAGQREDGYSAFHIRGVCLASLTYGLLGLILVFQILVERESERVAFWTCFLLLYATFLVWYMVYEAAMSHAVSFFMAALGLFVWWQGRERLSLPRGLVLGLILGLGASVRFQNGVLLMLPALSLLRELRARPAATAKTGAAVLAAFLLGAAPQMLAWKAIFGQYLLADPPHGRDFLRLDHPYVLNTLFSSRHGLLFWTPVLWGGFLGLLPLGRRDRFTAGALAAPLLLMSYVNACSGDWWAGGSFSNRRFDSVLPLLALGLAAFLARVIEGVRRRPLSVPLALSACLVLWNQAFIKLYRENGIPRDDTVSFAEVAEGNARILFELVGDPLAWPTNWVFAAEHDLPVARYDLMVGKYLFYRQNNLGGLVKVGDGRADPALFAGDWSGWRPCGESTCREVRGRARVMAPLDVPEDLDVTVRTSGTGTLELAVNGRTVAAFPLEEKERALRARVTREFWRRELNDVSLTVSPGGRALVERLLFERSSPGAPAGWGR